MDDFVIGCVTSRTSEFFVLNIGGPSEAVLGVLEFEGATKKNRP